MKRTHKVAVGLIGAVSLGLSVAAANAHQGPTGGGMHHGATGGSGPMGGGMHHGATGGSGPMGGGMHRGATGAGPAGPAAAQQLMTPEERTAIINKMRSATTPEERQKIAAENHAEMQKRAAEKGVSLSEQRGPRAGYGRHAAPATDTQTR